MRNRPARFATVSSSLNLRRLLAGMRRALWLCLALAVGGHLATTALGGPEAQQKAAKPLTTQFVKRAPRLTKPLELKKRPRPRRRQVQRTMVSVKARGPEGARVRGPRPYGVLEGLARPAPSIARGASLVRVEDEPQATSATVSGTRQPKQRIDMALEMMDMEALDTGQYHAMVIQDPTDRRAIRGYLHVAMAYSRSMRERDWHGFASRRITAIKRLAEAMNAYTSVKTDVIPEVTFQSRQLFKIPWVYSSTRRSFPVSYSDAQNLGKYMTLGGLFSADSDFNATDAGNKSLRELITEALRTQGVEHGRDWTFEDLPSSHPIYHCYFDFSRAPLVRPSQSQGKDLSRWKGLEGAEIRGRLLATISALWLWRAWGDWSRGYGAYDCERQDPVRHMQFGINLIIFALTQEGSITHRLMESVQ